MYGDWELSRLDIDDGRRAGAEKPRVLREVRHAQRGGHDDQFERTAAFMSQWYDARQEA